MPEQLPGGIANDGTEARQEQKVAADLGAHPGDTRRDSHKLTLPIEINDTASR
jgi:hypothetical protein